MLRHADNGDSLPYGLTPDSAALSIETSKAAQTAYQIASQPASAKEVDRHNTDDRPHHQLGTLFSEVGLFSEQDLDREGLLKHVKEILDKRKDWLSEETDNSEETQEARIIHLKTLFARLEDEQFKADAEAYEYKINEQLQTEGQERLIADIRQVQLSIEDKQASYEELELRRSKEAKAVASGRKRVEHMKSVLQRASAHRDLKQSLLQEKQELIKTLRQEIHQVSAKPSGGLLSAFKSFSLRRSAKE